MVETYNASPKMFNSFRNKILLGLMPFFPILVIFIILIESYGPNSSGFDPSTFLLTLALVLPAAGMGMYIGIKKQKKYLIVTH